MDSKSILTSKTFWANVIALAATLATANGFDLGLTPENQATLIAGIMSVVNIGIRLVTRGPAHVVKPEGK